MPHNFATELNAFQKNQQLHNSIHSLTSFNGGPLVRFDSWLDTFEAITSNSSLTEKDIILELYKKMVGKAHSTMKYILHSGDYSYDVIRRKLIDHFHGDETRETSLKKFMKMKRKPGEKIYDFAIRLKEQFKYAYPKEHGDETFEVILKEKFIDGLDEKLQMKVKYKQYENFDDLVAAARKYSTRIEGLNSDTRDKHDFINAVHNVNN